MNTSNHNSQIKEAPTMARYAKLYFAKKEEDIPISQYIMKLPEALRNKILGWKLGLKHHAKTTWNVENEGIQMPMTYTMYRQMPDKVRRNIFQKIEKKLLKRDITHVILPKLMGICPFETIEVCRGNWIKPFFVKDMIDFIAQEKIINKPLKDLEIILLDGNEKDVHMMVDLIYPHINYLTIITKEPERFEKQVENAFEDVGLNIQLLSYNKEAISQGDIIIDTHYDDPSVIRFCKKNSVYLDFGNHSEKTAMLLERENGSLVIDEFFLQKDNETISSTEAEVLLTVSGFWSRDYKETEKRIKEENIRIYNIIKDKLYV